jgi:methylphosphotriester-DNA--protein-cysteine methyltransferase
LLGHQGLISCPLGEWGTHNTVDAENILPSYVINAVFESINQTNKFQDRCKGLSTVLLSMIKHSEIDARVARYLHYCYRNPISNINLSDKQCLKFGVSARQLRRLTKLYLGHSPKDFSKVMRFQKVLKSLSLGGDKTVWVDHYYDQPHYIREFKRISGFTPDEFINLSVLYNHKSKQ